MIDYEEVEAQLAAHNYANERGTCCGTCKHCGGYHEVDVCDCTLYGNDRCFDVWATGLCDSYERQEATE